MLVALVEELVPLVVSLKQIRRRAKLLDDCKRHASQLELTTLLAVIRVDVSPILIIHGPAHPVHGSGLLASLLGLLASLAIRDDLSIVLSKKSTEHDRGRRVHD